MAVHPIAKLRAQSFGPFEEIQVNLAPGLNVIVGDNATGKSQLLKLLYSGTSVLTHADSLTKSEISGAMAGKLMGVFRPQALGRLSRRARGTTTTSVEMKFDQIGDPFRFGFSSRSRSEAQIAEVPNKPLQDEPVFLPSHELLSLGASFTALYNTRETPFEETWRDTVDLLLRPALRGPRGLEANSVMTPFSELLDGGRVAEQNGQFILQQPEVGNLEASLLAEGHRKLAMVMRLISNGVLLAGGYLFWDEPEANLNPRSQRAVSQALLTLAQQGSQIFVTTHSMFLLRELVMSDLEVPIRYIGLSRDQSSDLASPGAPVVAQSEENLEDLGLFAALEAEAEQSDRYLAW